MHLSPSLPLTSGTLSTAVLAVLIDSGSRHETGRFLGASHFLERMAYKSTTQRSHQELMKTLETLGGNFLCSSNRCARVYCYSFS